jgi:glyoxylase-like metal-dependent hydrolase (beta-lactamase superfamily II)
MLGKITTTSNKGINVHTYTAPDDGWHVNSHIVELADQLFVIDAQYTLPYAREVVSYAQSLSKQISRLYITHYHPDHLLGAVAFRAPIFALAEVKAKIDAVGDRVAAEEHEKRGEIVAAHAERPNRVVIPGIETIAGTRLEFSRLENAETENALTVGLPDHGILVTQDLIYHDTHVFVAERAFDTWAAAIRAHRNLPYNRILPGHGEPGGAGLYDSMLNYLSVAQEELSQAKDGADLKRRLVAAFPEYCGQLMLDHEMRFLFPAPSVTSG